MPQRPQHPSYLRHRRQVLWQIVLPVVLAGLVLIGIIYLIWWGTFRGNGDVARWAAIATMWLTLPVLIGTLVMLALIIAVTYLIGKLAGFIPRYTYIAQQFAMRLEAGAKKFERLGHRPLLIFPEIGGLVRKGFKRLRGT